jgi:serine/threonine-protein kinase
VDKLIERLQDVLEDQYAVERVLGAGGMAIVFLARDHKHQRPVAIKVLKPEVAASIGSDRFLREIQIAAQLQHPHILPLYDSGSADGLIYYVMPFVDGESLQERIARDGPLPVRDALSIATEVASALAHAHQQGVIHRDIKPGNILLSGGHAVVVDFGIARALRVAGSGSTQSGTIVGTPEYMSPEQAMSGERVDERADVYSLGCVLYEMLAGRPPFDGPTLEALISQSLTSEVPSVAEARDDVPPWVLEVIAVATAKDRNRRFSSASALRNALERPLEAALARPWYRRWWVLAGLAAALVIATAPVVNRFHRSASPHTVDSEAEIIAVLPFTAEGPGVELLGQGMADLIATNLDGVGDIRAVDPRTVLHRLPRRVRGDHLDRNRALEAGRQVNAGSVLLGNLVSAAGNVRMSADLYSVGGDRLARASAEGPIDSVFALADSLSLRLIREVWRSREPLPEFRISAITTGSLDAIRSYLRGEQHFRASRWDSATVAYQEALEADSTFALALLKLSIVSTWVGGHGDPVGISYSAAASRYANQLPARERLLVAGNELFNHGRIAAVDSLRAYAARYPKDAEGWFFLGEAQFHAQPLLALSTEEVLAPYEQVHGLDPTLTPAFIHPLELSLLSGDRERFDRYLEGTERNRAVDLVRRHRWLAEVAWRGAPTNVTQLQRAVETYGVSVIEPLANIALSTRPDLVDPLLIVLDSVQLRTPDIPPLRKAFLHRRWGLLLAIGRAKQVGTELEGVSSSDRNTAAQFAARVAITGYPRWQMSARTSADLADQARTDPVAAYLRAGVALRRGATREAHSILASTDTATAAMTTRAIIEAVAAWASVASDDTAAAISGMRGALEHAGFEPVAILEGDVVRYRFMELLLAYPATRPEGIRHARFDWHFRDSAPFLYPLQLLRLSEAYRAAGETAQAAELGERLRELWRDADPDIRSVLP